MSSTKLEDLPNEIITKVLSYFEIRDIIYFGHLSKRTRAVRRNKTLWRKVSIYSEHLKSEFLQFMLINGCKCLKLNLVWVKGYIHLGKPIRLQELSLENCEITNQALEELLGSCHSLKELTLRDIDLSNVNNKNLRKFVLQNRNTLQILDLKASTELDFESIQFIVNNCTELTEINFGRNCNGKYYGKLSKESINYLANNLTEKVVRLNLGNQKFVRDEHVVKLISRCKKLRELNLDGTSITKNSLTCIIGNLKHSLVILSLCNTKFRFDDLLVHNALPKLQQLFTNRHRHNSRPLQPRLVIQPYILMPRTTPRTPQNSPRHP